jgi:smad nuclear-interacting protein 1
MPRNRSRSPYRSDSRSPERRQRSSNNYSKRDSYRRSRSRSRSPRSRSPPSRRNDSQRRSRSEDRQRRPAAPREGGPRGGPRGGPKKYEWGKAEDNEAEPEEPVTKKQEVNFGLSGKLAAETNTYKGVEVKYNEPPEARTPSKKWRLYVFKGDKQIGELRFSCFFRSTAMDSISHRPLYMIDLLHIHRQSAFMFGRDRVVSAEQKNECTSATVLGIYLTLF